jgi:hypothetical protein
MALAGDPRFVAGPEKPAIIISDGNPLFGGDGELLGLVARDLNCFEQVALLTPAPEIVWGEQEVTLAAAGWSIFPATVAGLEALSNQLVSARAKNSFHPVPPPYRGMRSDVAARLERNADRWLTDAAPTLPRSATF